MPSKQSDIDTDPATSLHGLAPLTGFRPDVQALRGLAVLLVVLYHAQVVVPGGFVGVDLFFVISGYVIGRGIVAQLVTSDTVSFRGFYLRRARRILPAVSVMLAVVTLCAPLFAPVASITVTFRTAIAAALFNANSYLYFATSGGYFEPSAELNPLLHTWSLSVEEQFYFVIPALLYAGWRLGRRRFGGLNAFRFVVGTLFLLSLALCLLASFSDSIGPLDRLRFAFFSPFTRAWEFAAGLAIVVLPSRWFPTSSGRRAALGGGIALIALASFTFDDTTVFPGVAALLPVVGAALVIFSGTTASYDARGRSAEALRPVRWLGDVSYSWYLWHWPLIVFAGAFWPTSGRTPLVAAAVLSLLPAWFSYRFLEQRIMRTKQRHAWPTVALAGCCVLAPIGAALVAPQINAQVRSLSGPAELSAARESHLDNRVGCDSEEPIGNRPTELREKCTFGVPTSPMSVVLLGDSNAGQFSEALAAAADRTDVRLELATLSGCPVGALADELLDPKCERFLKNSIETLAAESPEVVVIGFSINTQILEGGGISRDLTRKAGDGLLQLVEELEGAGSHVVILATVPRPGLGMDDWALGECSNLLAWRSPERCTAPPFKRDRPDLIAARSVEEDVVEATGARLWDFSGGVCPADVCSDSGSDRFTWRDGNHITVASSNDLTADVTAAMEEVARG